MSSEMTSSEVGRLELQSTWLRYRSLLSTDEFLLVSHKMLVVVSGNWRAMECLCYCRSWFRCIVMIVVVGFSSALPIFDIEVDSFTHLWFSSLTRIYARNRH